MSIKFFGLVVLLVVTICKDLTAVTDNQSETIDSVLVDTVSEASDPPLGDNQERFATALSPADGRASGWYKINTGM